MSDETLLWHLGTWSLLIVVLVAIAALHHRAGHRNLVTVADMRASSHRTHGRIDELHTRCTTVEERLNSAPSHADLNKVIEVVGRIGGDVRNMQGQMSGITASMTRMERSLNMLTDHHINENKT